MLFKSLRRRAAKKELARAKSAFELAAAALVAANRAAHNSGKMLTPEMEAAGEELKHAEKRLLLAKSSLNRLTGRRPPLPLTELVGRKVRTLFPPALQAEAIRLLEKECGRDLPFHENADPQAVERVRLAVVKLAGGEIAELRRQVDVAKRDWRDVLAMAEEPEAFELGFVAYNELDAESRAAVNARDKRQYEAWLHEGPV